MEKSNPSTTDHAVVSRQDDLEVRIAEAVAEYEALLRSGATPDLERFLARYPDLAPGLRECIEAMHYVSDNFVSRNVRPNLAQPGTLTLLGDFQLLRRIGGGGMGDVYEAHQLSLARRVALKVLSAGGNEQALKRFQHEVRAAATLRHPHIVPVFSVGNDDKHYYYAMQFIEGYSLAELMLHLRGQSHLQASSPPAMSSDAPLIESGALVQREVATVEDMQSSQETVHDKQDMEQHQPADHPLLHLAPQSPAYFHACAELIRQAAIGLQHAHDHGIIHRDIKPGNILIDQHSHTWLADFGLARLPDSDLTATNDVLGTIRYMSPEQAAGRAVALDGRTDIYSLGATLYELITLRPLFQADERRSLLRKVIDSDPIPPRQLCRSLPRDLETVVQKALMKDREHRYASAQEFAEDLNRFLKDQPILARRPNLTQRLGRWVRRNRGWLGFTSALTFAFLLSGIIVLSVLLWVIQQQKLDLTTALQQEAEARQVASSAEKLAGERLEAEKLSRTAEQHMAYLRAVSLAHMELKSGNIEAASSLTDSCPPHLRDWEWGFVENAIHHELGFIATDIDRVVDIVALDDRKLLVHGSDHQTEVWALPEFNKIQTAPKLKHADIGTHSFPTQDGHYIIGYARSSDLSSNQDAQKQFYVAAIDGAWHQAVPIDALHREIRYSANSSSVYCLGSDGKLRIWSVLSKSFREPLDTSRSSRFAVSRNEEILAVASANTLRILDRTGRELHKLDDVSIELRVSSSLDFSPSGRYLAVRLINGDVDVYETETGLRKCSLTADVFRSGDFEFSPDEEYIATYRGFDNEIRLWSLDEPRNPLSIVFNAKEIVRATFSTDGATLFALTGFNHIHCWDLTVGQGGGRLLGRLPRGRPPVRDEYGERLLDVSPDGCWIAHACNQNVEIMDRPTGKRHGLFSAISERETTLAIAFDQSSQILRQLTHLGFYEWDVQGKKLARFVPHEYIATSVIRNAVTNRDAALIQVMANKANFLDRTGLVLAKSKRYAGDFEFKALRPVSGQVVMDYAGTKLDGPDCLTLSSDASLLAAASWHDKQLVVYQAGQREPKWKRDVPGRIVAATFDQQTKLLAVADDFGTMQLWDANEGTLVKQLAVPSQPRMQLAFSPSATRLFVAGGSPFARLGELRVYDLSTGQPLLRIPTDCAQECVAFAQGESELFAADYDGRLWCYSNQTVSSEKRVADQKQHVLVWHQACAERARSHQNLFGEEFHERKLIELADADTGYEPEDVSARKADLMSLDMSVLHDVELMPALTLYQAYALSAEYVRRNELSAHRGLVDRMRQKLTDKATTATSLYTIALALILPDASVDYDELIAEIDKRIGDANDECKRASSYLKGLTFCHMGRYPDAIGEFESITKLKMNKPFPLAPVAWLYMAIAVEKMGDHARAQQFAYQSLSEFESGRAQRMKRGEGFLVDFHYALIRKNWDSLCQRQAEPANVRSSEKNPK